MDRAFIGLLGSQVPKDDGILTMDILQLMLIYILCRQSRNRISIIYTEHSLLVPVIRSPTLAMFQGSGPRLSGVLHIQSLRLFWHVNIRQLLLASQSKFYIRMPY
jgi:hypothetical protein